MRIDRLNDMEEYVLQKRTASLEDLSQQFVISINTVRRDLPELLSRGTIQKVYGGVSAVPIQNELVPFSVREAKNADLKDAIGAMAAELVNDNTTIYLDSGSTTVRMLPYLANKSNVTIVSHSLSVLYESSKYPNLTVIALGGMYNPSTSSYISQTNTAQLSKMSFDIVFIAAIGVDLRNGLTNITYFESELKCVLMQRNKRIALMADHTKFGYTAPFSFCDFSDISVLITDKVPSQAYLDVISKKNIQLLCRK